ncbi:MAG: hypothetical protein GY874_18110 [Desulfobacteraceae bacterium]|nr:hypothetical protein [Desulfobacteraceae bacterium]
MTEETEKELRLDQEQYDLIKRCSSKKDMTEWNQWRKENETVEIWLGMAELSHVNLQEADLSGANLQGVRLGNAYLKGANLIRANFQWADLREADLQWADLREANLREANLQGAGFRKANLQGADLMGAKLQGAYLMKANLQEADLRKAKLQGADLIEANLQWTEFSFANLQGAYLWRANLQGAQFNLALVDGLTTISKCKFDKDTDFTGVGLDAATIDPGLKAAFKNNIRRKKWQEWLDEGNWFVKILKNIFVRFFWLVTGYGSSTTKIIGWFFGLSISFGLLYFTFETMPGLQGIIQDLRLEDKPAFWHVLWRSLYFSIVTMTTLGFGDMHAVEKADVWGLLGCVSLAVQVILGYVLLGALVTRLGILFTNEAPAAKPTPIEKDSKS